MSYKILIVDDSGAIRNTIYKALKSYDCDVIQATNGVECVSDATKDKPDLILLDAAMPVMDGVEAISKLKAAASTKSIPVIMLVTPDDNIAKISKMGIRDHINKPFKEDSLIDKIRQVIDLLPKARANAPKKNAADGLDIIVLENKPAIVKQMEDNLGDENWKIHGVDTAMAAIDLCANLTPDFFEHP